MKKLMLILALALVSSLTAVAGCNSKEKVSNSSSVESSQASSEVDSSSQEETSSEETSSSEADSSSEEISSSEETSSSKTESDSSSADSSGEVVKNKYNVTFLGVDGISLYSVELEEGETIAYVGETPTKQATAEFTYTFAGWAETEGGPALVELPVVSGPTTFYAVFTPTLNTYTITWVVGNTQTTTTVEYGKLPEFDGTPTKEADAQYVYTFKSWSPAIVEVTGNATYTAEFTETLRTYTVTLQNDNGTEDVVIENVPYGTEASVIYGEDYIPTKEGFTFKGWYLGTYKVESTDIVEKDMVLTAVYDAITYTITWVVGDTQTTTKVEYGKLPEFDGTPTKEATAQYTYTFKAWSPAIVEVTGDTTYTAEFTETLRTYTVTLQNNNGTEDVVIENVPYGTEASVIYGEDYIPTREGYTFKAWLFNSYEVKVTDIVTGDMVLTAGYDISTYTITWDVNGEKTTSIASYKQIPVYQGTPAITDDTKNVYLFKGWSTTVNGDVLDSLAPATADEEYFAVFETIELNGTTKSMYGAYTENVTLAGGQYYKVSAVKVSSGLFIYTQALFNTTVVNTTSANWFDSTNFEFNLNAGPQSFVTYENENARITKFFTKVEDVDGKKLHTVELYVAKDLINNWSEAEDVQLNFAWKNPGQPSYIISEVTNKANVGWNTDWYSYHRYGGVWTDPVNNPVFLANLKISSNGIYRVDNKVPTQDGITFDGNLTEYATPLDARGDSAKATVQVTGKVVNGNLYMGLIVTHGPWSAYGAEWHLNDNIELLINGRSTAVVFMQGTLIKPEGIDDAIAVTTEVDGKLVTTIELFVAGNAYAYKVGIGMAGNGFGGWQAIYWDENHILIDTVGPITNQIVKLENGIILDGNLTDSVWTESIKANKVTTTVNGATLEIIGTKATDGIYLGITVNHKTAPETSLSGGTAFWEYMNVEIRFNGDVIQRDPTQYLYTCHQKKGVAGTFFGYCKTEQVEGGYVSTFELFIPSSALANDGITAEQASVNFNIGAVVDGGFTYILGGDWVNPTLTITADGVTRKA